jgi:pyruvate, water dikinase
VDEVLGEGYHSLRWVISLDDGDTIRTPLTLPSNVPVGELIVTFDTLLQRSDFIRVIKEVLTRLTAEYQLPVDVEFAVSLAPAGSKQALNFHLLQCRLQNRGISRDTAVHPVPMDIPLQDQIFRCSRMAPQGSINRVDTLVLVDPAKYRALQNQQAFTDVARLIGRLNKALEGRTFILLGPGRWGSSDTLQGVPVTYADIFKTRALVELSTTQNGYNTEPSYGTHFFQDLVETEIFPLAVNLEDPEDYLNWDFLNQSADQLPSILSIDDSEATRCIKVISISGVRPDAYLDIAMDGKTGLGYLRWDERGW